MRKKSVDSATKESTNLRKWVIKCDVQKIHKSIENDGDPNFVSRSIPNGPPKKDYMNALALACMSKKPYECLKAIIDASKVKGLKLQFTPVDPKILNDNEQSKDSVLHSACINISQPSKLCSIIKLLHENNADFNYLSWNNMSAISYLLHEDASIADPREPLKLLIQCKCDPTVRCKIIENGPEDLSDDSQDEEYKEKFVYPSAKEPEKFLRGVEHALPENNFTGMPKWKKKEKIEAEVLEILSDARKEYADARVQSSKQKQEAIRNSYPKEYQESYKYCREGKRKDEAKVNADRNCLINKIFLTPLDLTNTKYNLLPQRLRKQKDKELKMYNPDCEPCRCRKQNGEVQPKEKVEVKKTETETGQCYFCKTSNKLSLCAVCRKISYCSRSCQKKDWARHKKDCHKVKKNRKATVVEIDSKTDPSSSDSDLPLVRKKRGSPKNRTQKPKHIGIKLNQPYRGPKELLEEEESDEHSDEHSDDDKELSVLLTTKFPKLRENGVISKDKEEVPKPSVEASSTTSEASKPIKVDIKKQEYKTPCSVSTVDKCENQSKVKKDENTALAIKSSPTTIPVVIVLSDSGSEDSQRPCRKRPSDIQPNGMESKRLKPSESLDIQNAFNESMRKNEHLKNGFETIEKLEDLSRQDTKSIKSVREVNKVFEKLIRELNKVYCLKDDVKRNPRHTRNTSR